MSSLLIVLLLFSDFIQQKCLILDEDIPHTWVSIMNSMTQMPYDAVKYKSKSIAGSSIPAPKESYSPPVPQIAENTSQLALHYEEQ
jgi:hypothetical protein